MELGFSVTAGPLSQISVSLFSVELAVQLATGAYGWWKARDRGHSMLGLVESRACRITTTSTFNLIRYVDKRRDSLTRGVARDPDGVISCVSLPNASSASSGDQGIVCLRAVTCALMCFYDSNTVLDILIGVLPGTIYTSDQEGGNEEITGPLLASLRQFVIAAGVEEDSDDLRQRLLDVVDSLLPNVTGATKGDIFDCDNFLESDVPNFIGALRWILTPVLKREQNVYPTRSLKVWALSLIMAQLGFEVAASMHAISSRQDYEAYVQNTGYQATFQEVILVTSNHGPTDPLSHQQSSRQDPGPSTRIGTIRSIPWVVFRNLQDNQGLATPKYLSEAWEYTFDYVYGILEPAQPGKNKANFETTIEFTEAANQSFGKTLHEKLKHIDQKSKFWEEFQWLTFVTSHPLKKFVSHSGKDSIWNNGIILSQFKDDGSEYAVPPDQDNLDDWYITRVVFLATIYAVCFKWIHKDDTLKSPLDTEIAFCSEYLRRGNLTPWVSYEVFRALLMPKNHPARGFWATATHQSWFQLIVNVFCGSTRDPVLDARSKKGNSRDTPLLSTLGVQRNGIVILPSILLYPSSDSSTWFRYHIRVGQLLDLPLDDDGLVCAADIPSRSSAFKTWKPEPEKRHTTIENLDLGETVRIDAEPWWESDERSVVFRARIGGVVKAVFSPEAILTKYHSFLEPSCSCTNPLSSLQLSRECIVVSLADYLLHQYDNVDIVHDRKRLQLIVQTGGDLMARFLCLAISKTRSVDSLSGCLHGLEMPGLSSELILL